MEEIKVLYADSLRLLIEKANLKGLKKNEIISIINNNGLMSLVYLYLNNE